MPSSDPPTAAMTTEEMNAEEVRRAAERLRADKYLTDRTGSCFVSHRQADQSMLANAYLALLEARGAATGEGLTALTREERYELIGLLPVVMVPTSQGWKMKDEPDACVVGGIIQFFDRRQKALLSSLAALAAVTEERDRMRAELERRRDGVG